MRKKILLIICALLSAGLLGAAAYIFMSSNGEAYDRINLEKDLADSYLEFVMSDENQKTTQSTRLEQESETEDVEAFIDQGENEELSTEFFDEENQEEGESGSEEAETDAAEESTSDTESESDEWGVEYVDVEGAEPETLNFDDLEENAGVMEYSRWSPDYAQGTIDCVFEYPKLGIKRGVYKGAILNDLECWMVVTANDYMELGKTSYAMFGHNSMTYEVSLNALLNARLGQKFTLTSKEGEYEYTVSDIFYMDRDSATRKYARQFEDNPVNKAYILTCGRYEHRYTDMIVEGTLRKFTTAAALL